MAAIGIDRRRRVGPRCSRGSRKEAEKAGCRIERIVVAFEAGRDGFWLARWLKARSIEAHVIHAASVAVSRETATIFVKGEADYVRVATNVKRITLPHFSVSSAINFANPTGVIDIGSPPSSARRA